MARVTDMPRQLAGGDTNDVLLAKTFVSKDRYLMMSVLSISDRWFNGIDNAAQTYKVTTQKGARSAILSVSRRYRTDVVLTGQEK